MTPEQLEELKQAAMAATPGPWDIEDDEVGHDVAPFVFVHKPGPDGASDDGMRIKVEKHHLYPARKPVIGGPAWNALAECALLNADYIRRANPSAILSLIAQVEALTVPQWQPIDTAPRTGPTLLLGRFNSMGNWRTMRGQWFTKAEIDEGWEETDGFDEGWYETAEEPDCPNCWAIDPTHWALPPATPTIPAIPGAKEGA